MLELLLRKEIFVHDLKNFHFIMKIQENTIYFARFHSHPCRLLLTVTHHQPMTDFNANRLLSSLQHIVSLKADFQDLFSIRYSTGFNAEFE